ncbi:MAG: sphingosine kinase [Myxococcales bacterium]|nr:sphingosine kinase [Myxococcales bacterium]
MAGIGLVLNPKAKQHLRDPELAERLAREIDGAGVVRAPHSFEELVEVAGDFRRQGVELVAVAGGDGTNHITITGLVEAYEGARLPYFALLRGGTMNTIANSFGVPRKSPEALLNRYRRAYERRALSPMRFIEPNVLQVGKHCGFIFGTGAIYGFIAEYNQREERSPAWAAQVLARAIASGASKHGTAARVAQRWTGTVRFPDGTAFPERDYFTVGASTCGQIGLGFKPFHRSGEVPDRFHMLGIHTTTLGFIRSLPTVWRGQTIGGDKTYEKLTDAAILEAKDGKVPYTLDGDVYVHDGPLEVKAGPRIRIVIPS